MSTVQIGVSPDRTMAAIVAENVRAEAARRGFSQVALGRALGLGQNQVARRWRGVTPWTLDEMGEVAEVLGVSVQDLVTDFTEKQNPDRWIAPSGAAARPKGLEPPTFWLVADAPVASVTDLGAYRLRRAS